MNTDTLTAESAKPETAVDEALLQTQIDTLQGQVDSLNALLADLKALG